MATSRAEPGATRFRFGTFEVDLCRRELFKYGTRLRLQKQPFEILCVLLERPGEVVTREVLQRRLWPDDTYVEYADSLNTAMRKLRAALSDSSDQPRYIETVARQGYRFIAPVQILPDLPNGPSTEGDARARLEVAESRHNTTFKISSQKWLAAALAMVLLAGVGVGFWLKTHRPTASGISEKSANELRAEDLYQKGRLFWNKRTPAGLTEALHYFEQAVTLDPRNARAYAGIADAYALMSGYDLAPADEYIPKARAAALHAIELDPKLAEPHASLAVIAQNYDWDWKTAEEEYRRAIEFDPNYATAHQWYAECLALQGKFPEATREIDRAKELDPSSLIIGADRGSILFFARQYEPAAEQFRAVLELEPFFPRAFMINWVYIQQGDLQRARENLETWRHIRLNNPWDWATIATIEAHAHNLAAAKRALETVEQLTREQNSDPMPMLAASIAVGDKDKSIEYLELAFQRHSPSLTSIKVDPTYEPLRSDPRFANYLKRLNLEP